MTPRRFLRTRALFVSFAIAGSLMAPAATGAMTASAGKLKAPVAELIYFDEGSHYMAFTFANGDPGNAYLADGARIMLEGHRRGTTADLQPGTKVLRMRMRGGLVRFLLLRPVSG